MKTISTGWIFDNLKDFEIQHWLDIRLLNFLGKSNKQRINIWDENNFVYNVFIDKTIDFDINIFVWKSNTGFVNLLCMSYFSEIKWKINVNMVWDANDIKLNIIWLVWENWKVDCSWNFLVYAKTKGNVWDLMQENIFLWEKGKACVVPQLNIKSDQSQTSHWVKIQKLDKDKLFYIQSKWLDGHSSQDLMMMSYFQNFFEGFNIEEKQIQWYLNCLNQKCQI